MSNPLLPHIEIEREVANDPDAEYWRQRRRLLFDDDLANFGPKPWCRVCQKEVEYASWTRYQDFFGFYVRCHGEQQGGLISTPQLTGFLRLEVFCFDDPHRQGYVWWVNKDGTSVQWGRKEIARQIARSGIFTWLSPLMQKIAPWIIIAFSVWQMFYFR